MPNIFSFKAILAHLQAHPRWPNGFPCDERTLSKWSDRKRKNRLPVQYFNGRPYASASALDAFVVAMVDHRQVRVRVRPKAA